MDSTSHGQQSYCWQPVCANAQSQPDDSVVEAVWKPQRMNFVYRGYSTLYSCGGLQQKLEKILTTVGARGGIEMRAYSCDDALAIARFQIVLTSPVEATPENVAATHDVRCARRAGRARAR